jgi:hypothetical protein
MIVKKTGYSVELGEKGQTKSRILDGTSPHNPPTVILWKKN